MIELQQCRKYPWLITSAQCTHDDDASFSIESDVNDLNQRASPMYYTNKCIRVCVCVCAIYETTQNINLRVYREYRHNGGAPLQQNDSRGSFSTRPMRCTDIGTCMYICRLESLPCVIDICARRCITYSWRCVEAQNFLYLAVPNNLDMFTVNDDTTEKNRRDIIWETR